jgi:alkylation response protein AidB-like acyl-CoA dehydrogenase
MGVSVAPVLDTEEQQVLERIEQLLREHDPKSTDPQTFWGAQFDAGLAWVHFPVGRGGLGLSPRHQVTIQRRLGEAGAPDNWARNVIGLGISAPVIIAHGTEEQKERYLRAMYTCEEIWCQLMSEPGAGSDMAGLSTRAVRSGDEWIVNGQKVWTTLAHVARRGTLIARTDPDAPKHKGMTHFVIDMHDPGVEVRPLRQITGDAEFNEVYFTDARIPDTERLGDEGDGWRVALTMLMNERVAIGAGRIPPRGSGPIREAMRLLSERRSDDPVMRDRVIAAWIDAEVARLTNIRAGQMRKLGTPGPEGSVGKLVGAELAQRIYSLCLDLMGPEGALNPQDVAMHRPESFGMASTIQQAALRSMANTIEGGTSEIMRNILGERVLGLPGDPRTDKDVPWRDVPRS